MEMQGIDLFWKILTNFGVPFALLLLAIYFGYKMSKKAVEYWLKRDEKNEKLEFDFRQYLMETSKELSTIVKKNTEINEKMIKVWEEVIILLRKNNG